MRRARHDPALNERALAIMERQVRQLVRLTDDLLDVSRITRNRLELRRERLDLRSAIRSAIETIEPLSDAAGHVVTVRSPGRAALGGRRPDAAGAGVREPAEQRRQVHRSRRPHHAHRVGGRERRDGHADRHRDRHRPGRSPAHLRHVRPGRADRQPRAQRSRHRPRAREAPRSSCTADTIEARSEGAGTGTTFVVRLPIVAAVRREQPSADRAARAARAAASSSPKTSPTPPR